MTTPEQQHFDDTPSFDDIVNLTDEILVASALRQTAESLEVSEEKPLFRMRHDDVYIVEAAAKSLGLSDSGAYALRMMLKVQQKNAVIEHYRQRKASSETVSQHALVRWLERQRDAITKKIAGDPTGLSNHEKDYAAQIEVLEPLSFITDISDMDVSTKATKATLRRITFGGVFSHQGKVINLAESGPVIDIQKYHYYTNDFNASPQTNGREHYLLLPHTDQVYANQSLGIMIPGARTNTSDQTSAALAAATTILHVMQSHAQ
jgi:hypothetical protein